MRGAWRAWLLVVLAAGALLPLSACGDDDDSDDEDNGESVSDGSTIVEQSTQANIGPYRVGIIRVDEEDGTAVVSVSKAEGSEPAETVTLREGEPYAVEGGAIVMTAPRDGGDERDTVRLRFEADY